MSAVLVLGLVIGRVLVRVLLLHLVVDLIFVLVSFGFGLVLDLGIVLVKVLEMCLVLCRRRRDLGSGPVLPLLALLKSCHDWVSQYHPNYVVLALMYT